MKYLSHTCICCAPVKRTMEFLYVKNACICSRFVDRNMMIIRYVTIIEEHKSSWQ